MPGKAYSMKEMKQIVDYLVENKLYSEIRGRKMWMDFANTKLLTRSWQSLKETFLKRILPDIHNPYYKLTVQQIISFRQQSDVEKPKLEVHTVSSNSSGTEDNQEKKQPSTSKANEGTKSGEDIKCLKIDNRTRSSTETLVLERYETAEEILKVLESDSEEIRKKPLKDCLTYSEPLTPMIQAVIDDFSTDDEEPRMRIVEDIQEPADSEIIRSENKTESPAKEKMLEDLKKSEIDVGKATENNSEIISKPEQGKKSLKLKKMQKNSRKVKNSKNHKDSTSHSENVADLSEKLTTGADEKEVDAVEEKATQNCSNNTPDSVLPNNQEGLANIHFDDILSNETSKTDISEDKNKSDRSLKRNTNESFIPKKKLRSSDKITCSVEKDGNEPKENNIITEKITTVEVQPMDEVSNDLESEKLACEKVNESNKEKPAEVGAARTSDIIDDSQPQNVPTNVDYEPNKKSMKSSNNCNNAEKINPCLKSVSLFAAQFCTTKYDNSDSDNGKSHAKSRDEEIAVAETNEDEGKRNVTENSNKNNHNTNDQNEKRGVILKDKSKLNQLTKVTDVLVLNSHSDSDSDVFQPPPKKINKNSHMTKAQREKALANIFGFTSGRPSRKRTVSHRDRSIRRYSEQRRTASRHTRVELRSNSSDEYSTLSEEDTFSPPQNKSRRHDRKYIQPEPYRIMSYPGEGGLFVMDGKKIYPIVRHGMNVKNFVTCWPEDESDDEQYWKKKYIEEKQKAAEEKIRADELARLLQRAVKQQAQLESSSSKQESNVKNKERKLQTVAISSSSEEVNRKSLEENPSKGINNDKDPTVKIKVNKDHEIELECRWLQLNPILEKISHLFHNQNNTGTNTNQNNTSTNMKPPDTVLISSGKSTPVNNVVDPETKEKVNKLENEIFKEIEERDKSTKESTPQEENVTHRKRTRQKKVSPATSTTTLQNDPENITNKPNEENEKSELENKDQSKNDNQKNEDVNIPPPAVVAAKSPKATKKSKSNENKTTEEKKSKDELQTKSDPVPKKPTRSPNKNTLDVKSPHKTRSRSMSSSRQEVEIPDDNNVRYKFAPQGRSRKLGPNTSCSYANKARLITSPDTASLNSVESTLGYQDSDVSPTMMLDKRKRKLSFSDLVCRRRDFRNRLRRKSHPYLKDNDWHLFERNKSLSSSIRRSQNSSLNTDVYRSDSYDLLMNKVRSSFKQLDKIDEKRSQSENTATSNYLTPDSITTVNSNDKSPKMSSSNFKTTENSSNVSLPLSPTLSIVENISISKDTISNLEDTQPTINETLRNENDISMNTALSKYMMSEVDLSLPLMQQDCKVKSNKPNKSKTMISDSILNKISTVNIEAQSPSDALHKKLQNLLLESAKKVEHLQMFSRENAMEVDPMPIKENERTKSKKRCSTPRKKRNERKSKASSIDPVVEERTESCSRGGRQSCPPVINIILCEDENTSEILTELPINRKGRKKKDIIKVKIQRPREKNRLNVHKKRKRPKSDSRLSNNGTNDPESGIFLHHSDESVDLIHNHSDTCLHANECINDNLEIIENKSKSVASSYSSSDDNRSFNETKCRKHGLPEAFCCNVQNSVNGDETSPKVQKIEINSGGTAYFTPKSEGSLNSLMTEDLSEESPPQTQPKLTKWHLIGEEETHSSFDFNAQDSNGIYVYSNLKQIFPVTCTVPNLSTISENTESNSRRPTNNDKNDESTDLVTKSIFDTTF